MTIDPDNMAKDAAVSILAAERTCRQDLKRGGVMRTYPIAGMVLAALAVEQVLKAVIVRAENLRSPELLRKRFQGPDWHSLQFVFSQCPQAIQDEIRVEFSKTRPLPVMWKSLAIGESQVELERAIRERDARPPDFDRDLAENSKSFVEWRYTYESARLFGSPSFLHTLARAAVAVYERGP